MNLIRLAIERPIAVVAAVLMVIMFGLLALQTIPIQLTPDVRRPVITITTNWAGAAPAEVEREIIIRQEEVLTGLTGLEEMLSQAYQGYGEITLEFAIGQNMDRALLLVSNRLNRVEGYPNEADEPTLDTASAEDKAIAWFTIIHQPGNEREMHEYGDFFEDVVKERIERVPGISRVNMYGGSEREIRVTIVPENLARYRLTVPEVVLALQNANSSASAGYIDEGKRRYTVRSEGDFEALDDIRSVVVRSLQDIESDRLARVTVDDLGEVSFDYKEPSSRIRFNGQPALVFNAIREAGANVIETMKGVREAVDELNAGVMPDAGLELIQVYDETIYIDSAIALVEQNIWIGGVLAAFVLLVFLRSPRATLIVSIAIPISVIGSFVAMAALGRSINVVSLAGLAFAVGMVVDAAIVVLENIYRLRQQGMPTKQAAYEGARQVWGAILVSALTTVMVFIPILVMELEAGQVFRDIAVAISVSVLLSLVVAVTLIPALSAKILTRAEGTAGFRLPFIDVPARAFNNAMGWFARFVVKSSVAAVVVVGGICVLAVVVADILLPKLEYLPEGNQNFVFGSILPPPGYNLDTMAEIAARVEAETRPYWEVETGPEDAEDGSPKFQRFYFVASPTWTFVGGAASNPDRVRDLIPLMRDPVFEEPGTFGFFSQPSLFGRGVGGGRNIDLNISGPELEPIYQVALQAYGLVAMNLPEEAGNQIRPRPGLENGSPEVRVFPNRVKLADNDVTARELAMGIDAFNSGIRVDEISVDGKEIDLMLTGPDDHIDETQGIGELPIVTRSGVILPVSSLTDIEVTSGPTQIRRLERERTVTLQIGLADDIPLETGIEIIRDQVIAPLEEAGLPPGVTMEFSGTADKLSTTWDAMVLNLLVALIIVYLVMAVLFESFIYPLIVMVSVPVAAAGGVLGLAIVGLPLDMLTMLGFVILIGIVVNNAILLVHQTLHHIREDAMSPGDAVEEAVRNRVRPIFMSTLTSVCGMLPLVVFPGAGSELYRGLGSVVVGGLSLSAVLTLALVPPLLGIFLKVTKPKAHAQAAAAGQPTREPAE
ncbi:MAG: efflux RND transporter permease subunit [Pseudomonadota bacterium]